VRRLLVLVGTRPEVIKMAPMIRALLDAKRDFVFVHTGQHYDYNMSLQFIEELRLPKPDIGLPVRILSPDEQLACLIRRVGTVLRREKISAVLVEGDTNSVLAGALAANKLRIPIGHVEAGLRSYDLRMPEEYNRRIVDHLSSYLFAPTETAKLNLKREATWGTVQVTGNTVIDACIQHMRLAERRSHITEAVPFADFALATIHRAENVDDPDVLKEFVDAFTESPIEIVLPLHPRTKKQLKQHGLWMKLARSKNVAILPPVGYFDFLVLMKHCSLILTDSGGVVEEATAPVIRKKVVILRLSTERPEAVKSGFARVAGCNKNAILRAIRWAEEKEAGLPAKSPFGDGHSAQRIVEVMTREGAL
jgi:UDP-N-acetylglucosamine 2-epimerase (non-hydrolysing)